MVLALIMLLSLAVCANASAVADDAPSSASQQLKLISSQIDSLEQKDTQNQWYYCVADLDHNGCLEFIAASQHPADRSTNLKVWTVSKDAKTLTECALDKPDDESFPDIMTDTMDTYYVKDTDTWYYMAYDNVVISDSEVYTVKTAVNLKDGTIRYDAYAVEHTLLKNGAKIVSYTDPKGISISADQFNASGDTALAGAKRSNTAFEWLTADKIRTPDRLTESYEVFMGIREPTETFPVPKPVALGGKPTPSPSPSVSPQPVKPIWLTITKNPTNENKKVGGSAVFVACANAYESLNWTFVSPNGGQYSPANFISGSRASVSGEYSTTITVSGLESWMDGWGAFCTFYYQGQSARTSTAYISIKSTPPTPTPTPTPTYGSMGGLAYEAGGGYAIDLQNGDEVYVDSWMCNVEGRFYDGCSAVVYYVDYPSEKNIYQVSIYGDQGLKPDPEPYSGTIGGTAYEGGGGYALYLDDGTQVYVDSWICKVEGQFYDGCQAVAYYVDYPSSENIYQVDIYGNQGLLTDDPYETGLITDDPYETGLITDDDFDDDFDVDLNDDLDVDYLLGLD